MLATKFDPTSVRLQYGNTLPADLKFCPVPGRWSRASGPAAPAGELLQPLALVGAQAVVWRQMSDRRRAARRLSRMAGSLGKPTRVRLAQSRISAAAVGDDCGLTALRSVRYGEQWAGELVEGKKFAGGLCWMGRS